MSSSTTFNSEDSDLITSLHALSAKSPKLVKSSAYAAPADASIQVRSWKMNEFKYYDIPSPFPTLARGLFSKEIQEPEEENEPKVEGQAGRQKAKKYQIVVRGYDKFFNIGEVPWTTWASLEEHTAPPYVLSLKSNGCIIFIAALTPTKLIVTSKHSIGPIQNVQLSHAQAGEGWLRKYLDKLGKKEADLAAVLWEKNWTAIAELCDDSFEEHVLGYSPEKTGLHLHGLNVRSKEFKTMPTETVDAFADEWGFIKTATKTLNTIKEVKEFTDACAATGEWNGEMVEGFVVRTHVTEPPTAGRNSNNKGKGKERDGDDKRAYDSRSNRSPYAAGSSFFFKVKFDEPYMMYRDWREVTKSLLSAKGPMSPSILPKSKMKRAETKVYVKWVIEEIKKDRGAFKDYTKGKGIIATREKFLKWLKSEKGKEGLNEVQGEGKAVSTEGEQKFGKTVILPVAIPGCGKTAVAVALAHLFGFAHTQSDDIHVKKAAPVFIKNVMKLLETNDVVIADKNNHLKQHRQQLREAAQNFSPPVRLLALNWALDQPPAMIHRICGDRVQARRDNHQTLRADTSAAKAHEEVLWMFINTTEELIPAEVDNVIEMEVDEGLEAAVRRAVKEVAAVLRLDEPNEEAIMEALEVVGGYVPETKKPDEKNDKNTKRKQAGGDGARYYGLLPEVDLVELLDSRLGKEDVDQDTKAAWEALKKGERVTKRPHVTIVHSNARKVEEGLWNRCAALQAMNNTPPTFKGTLGRVMWNGRVMAVTVEGFGLDDPGAAETEGKAFVTDLEEVVKNRLHITVGTRTKDIAGVEAKGMVEGWKNGGSTREQVKAYTLDGIEVKGRVKALMS